MEATPHLSTVEQLFAESGMASSHVPVDPGLVSTRLEEDYGLVGALQPLATEKDDTFRLRTIASEYLVKVSPPDEAATTVGFQTAAMRFLERSAPELPVQRVRLSLDGRDNVVLHPGDDTVRVLRVFTFVEGALWTQASPDAARLAQLGEMLGRVDVALGAFAHPADRRGLVWDLRHFHRLTGLLEQTTDARQRQLAEEVFRLYERVVVPNLDDLEMQVIHGDYSPFNVVVDEHGDDYVAGVIDFGDAVRSAVIFDPAVAMANLVGRSPEHPWRDACAFVAGYESARPIRDQELSLLPVAAVARLALRGLITNWRAERVPARREYLLSHAKDDWVNVERALSVSVAEVVANLRPEREVTSRRAESGSIWS
ncbi:MAG TPA: phosphotransferase [Nocardioidaceae bacterium]|nr:phosphotransferase [Nocardioidaceae bacterium]